MDPRMWNTSRRCWTTCRSDRSDSGMAHYACPGPGWCPRGRGGAYGRGMTALDLSPHQLEQELARLEEHPEQTRAEWEALVAEQKPFWGELDKLGLSQRTANCFKRSQFRRDPAGHRLRSQPARRLTPSWWAHILAHLRLLE